MEYIYETHLHTCMASACGKSHGYEYIDYYKSLGYSGIIVTDHFFNGNCAIPKDIPWKDRVELFCKGYEEAKEEGDKKNFQVFFSWECNFSGDEYLVYGLDKQWLLDHPDILEWDHIKHYNMVHEAGGLVVQAHPFRVRGYLSRINIHPFQCDAWEVANAGNMTCCDKLAYAYAKKYGITMTAGSDIHRAGQTDNGEVYGVAFDTPLTSIQDYVERIKSGKGIKLHVPSSRIEWEDGTTNLLPVYLFDKSNNATLIDDISSVL